MSDIGRDRAYHDEDRLPWLEPVDEVDEGEGPSPLKLALAVVVALVAISLVVGGVVWLRGRGGEESGAPGTIAAPEGEYKVRPGDPGGMQVAGQGDAVPGVTQGNDGNAPIDFSAVPEEPVDRVTTADAAVGNVQLPPSTAPSAAPQPRLNPPKPAAAAPKPAQVAIATPVPAAAKPATPAPKPATPAPTAAPAASGGGSTVQLGAFSSEAKANAAWSALAGRFGFLGGLSKQVIPVQSGGKTLYRLRAGGADGSTCGKLKVAGESCTVVN